MTFARKELRFHTEVAERLKEETWLIESLRERSSGKAIGRATEEMKRIRLTKHAGEQARERGASEADVRETIDKGSREPAKHGRELCRYNFAFGRTWQGKTYAIKQVVAVIKEEAKEVVVITVYTFYF